MAGTPKKATKKRAAKKVAESRVDINTEETQDPEVPVSASQNPENITPQQKLFCYAWHATGSAAEAFRTCGMGDPDANHVRRRAVELTRLPQIQEYMAFLESRALKNHEITIEKLTQNLLEDRDLAFATEDAKAAIAADLGLAKLHGLLVHKTESKSEASLDVLIQQARQRAALPSPESKTLEQSIIEGEVIETTI